MEKALTLTRGIRSEQALFALVLALKGNFIFCRPFACHSRIISNCLSAVDVYYLGAGFLPLCAFFCCCLV